MLPSLESGLKGVQAPYRLKCGLTPEDIAKQAERAGIRCRRRSLESFRRPPHRGEKEVYVGKLSPLVSV